MGLRLTLAEVTKEAPVGEVAPNCPGLDLFTSKDFKRRRRP